MDPLRRALADNLGKTLTPELCVAIEAAAGNLRPDPTPIDLAQFTPLDAGDYLIAVERFDDVLPELLPLHELHWSETELHRHGLAMKPNYSAMSAHDRAGSLLQFTVRRSDGPLIGNLRMFVLPSLHTDGRIAEEDTLFIHPDHRDGMLGLKLLRYAEACLRALGVESIGATSKTLNNADVLLRRMGYTPVAIQFHKILKGT